MDGKVKWGRLEAHLVEEGGRKGYVTERNEEATENGKEYLHFARANGMNEWMGHQPILIIKIAAAVTITELLNV
jgi:hypothetical protein